MASAKRYPRLIFSWIRSQLRRALRKCFKGLASNKERALPPPRNAPKERSSIQVRELRACETTSQWKISDGLSSDQNRETTLVTNAKSSLPAARAEPLMAPAEEPPTMGKGLPCVCTRFISP